MKTYYIITKENPRVFKDEHFERILRHAGNQVIEPIEVDLPYYFRCCDDDGCPYFYGYTNNDSTFQPLDYEGANYGCTMIEYLNQETREWELL